MSAEVTFDPIVTVPCPKCSGEGNVHIYWVEDGRCFQCGGSGIKERVRQSVLDRRAKARESARKRRARKAEAEKTARAGKRDRYLAARPELAKALDTDTGDRRANATLADLADQLFRKGKLSNKQIAYAIKLAAPPICDRCQGEHKTQDCPNRGIVEANGKRQEVAGVVASIKTVETDWGDTVKMLVVRDDGAKLWGSVPTIKTKDESGQFSGYLQIEVGDRVSFMAAVEPSRDDPHFGFFKRPTKAKLIKELNGEQR